MAGENIETDTEDKNYDDYSASDDQNDQDTISEYDITATPNDFNILTIYQFIESKTIKIPGFQRNYVWDIKRASKLIESLIVGLPVPQIFLYEEARNSFLVIDGQQRLMSIFYFFKKRFPRKEKRAELRKIFNKHGTIPDEILEDDSYFTRFNLNLPESLPDHRNKFKGLNYDTLKDYQYQFNLRPIRNVIVKQNSPSGDRSAMYEIFNRLNTGGINLKPQEIRTSLYHSDFYDVLSDINDERGWRRFLVSREPDLHCKDIEILLRGFALLIKEYRPSLTRFLNQFSEESKTNEEVRNKYLNDLCHSFLKACSDLPDDIFLDAVTGRFSIALYEAVFSITCKNPYAKGELVTNTVDITKVRELKSNEEFKKASLEGSTSKSNVTKRLEIAVGILLESD